MTRIQKENIQRVERLKNKILDYYPFIEKENRLECRISSREKLIFYLFPKGGTIDLYKSVLDRGVEKEEEICLGFSFEDKQTIEILKDFVKRRYK